MSKTAKPPVKKTTRKPRQKKIIIGSIAVAATGILGYFGWKYLQDKKKETGETGFKRKEPEYIPPPAPVPPVKVVYVPVEKQKKESPWKRTENKTGNYQPEASEFPLKPGSRGEKVRMLQDTLIAKHGRQYFPKYGADGQFGIEMARGLAKLKLPATISESVYHVLVEGAEQVSLADLLKQAAEKKDFAKAIALLKRIKNTDGYTEVNKEFSTLRINGGVRQTVVNGLLNSFTKPIEKEAIRLQFLRMGLQYDGKKWSLSGLDGLPLVTIRQSRVWVSKTESFEVPARMVLGNEITRKSGYILFENKGRHFLIHEQSVNHL
jgi:predicted CopG family antitoxin